MQQIAYRDAPLMVFLGLLVHALAFWTGLRTELIPSFAILLGILALIVFLNPRFPSRDDDIPVWLIIAEILVCFGAVMSFIMPALGMAALPDITSGLIGLIVMFAISVHVTSTYSEIVFFNLAQLLPTALAACLAIYSIITQWGDPGLEDWIFCLVSLLAYVGHSFEALRRNRTAHTKLDEVKTIATARLRELEHISQHDTLTDVLNRRAFDDRVTNWLTRCRQGNGLTIFVIDLNGFKPINDTYSHAAGDAVLLATARRLRQLTVPRGLVARLGGDEFIIAIMGLTTTHELHQMAAQVADTLAQPVSWRGRDLSVTASLGIARTEDPATSLSTICAQADQAMFLAKTRADGTPVIYDEHRFLPRPTLEDRKALALAIEAGEFRPFYQPKVDLATGRIIGFEALARWAQPSGTLRLPNSFVNLITELGLEPQFLHAISAQVIADINCWHRDGLNAGQISINISDAALSTRSGRRDLLEVLSAHHDGECQIVLEITEDVFLGRSGEINRDSIRALRSAGYRISLDDFGTGYASINHLRELDFDELKIDASFVSDLAKDSSTEVLINGILTMARGLGVDVIAEGIETEAQRHALQQLGCQTGQGFLWSPALSAQSTRQVLERQARQRATDAPQSQDIAIQA